MIQCENLVKIYKTKDTEVIALQGLELSVAQGEVVAIIGNSGSGKSTLLNTIGGLDKPTAGKLMVDGKDLFRFNAKDYLKYKRETVGFVWQNNARNLIPYMTTMENVQLPQTSVPAAQRHARAAELLELVGLGTRKNNQLHQLSGGEQQRVAIAIALSNKPKLLLADEPTGSVDNATTGVIMDIFKEVNRSLGTTIVIVTHDMAMSRKVGRVIAIRDGRTSSEFIHRQAYIDRLREGESTIMEEAESHVELAVLDAVGRVQIPKEYLQEAGIHGRAKMKVEIEGNRIMLINPEHLSEEERATSGSSRIAP